MTITKASALFMKKDVKKKFASLCLSGENIIHIMHHLHEKSVCGDIAGITSCQLIKRLAIRDILDYWIEKIEAVKHASAISSVWDNIDKVRDESDFFKTFDGMIDELCDVGFFDDAILESNTITGHTFQKPMFCSKCMGIFLTALFRDNKDSVRELVKKYILEKV